MGTKRNNSSMKLFSLSMVVLATVEACNDGYAMKGGHCEDVDECSNGTHDCNPNGFRCLNTPGAFFCMKNDDQSDREAIKKALKKLRKARRARARAARKAAQAVQAAANSGSASSSQTSSSSGNGGGGGNNGGGNNGGGNNGAQGNQNGQGLQGAQPGQGAQGGAAQGGGDHVADHDTFGGMSED